MIKKSQDALNVPVVAIPGQEKSTELKDNAIKSVDVHNLPDAKRSGDSSVSQKSLPYNESVKLMQSKIIQIPEVFGPYFESGSQINPATLNRLAGGDFMQRLRFLNDIGKTVAKTKVADGLWGEKTDKSITEIIHLASTMVDIANKFEIKLSFTTALPDSLLQLAPKDYLKLSDKELTNTAKAISEILNIVLDNIHTFMNGIRDIQKKEVAISYKPPKLNIEDLEKEFAYVELLGGEKPISLKEIIKDHKSYPQSKLDELYQGIIDNKIKVNNRLDAGY